MHWPWRSCSCAGAAHAASERDGAGPGCQWGCQWDARVPVDTGWDRPARATRIALVRWDGSGLQTLGGTALRWLQNRCEQRPCSGGFDSRPPPRTGTRTNRGRDKVRLDARPGVHQALLIGYNSNANAPGKPMLALQRRDGLAATQPRQQQLSILRLQVVEQVSDLLNPAWVLVRPRERGQSGLQSRDGATSAGSAANDSGPERRPPYRVVARGG